MSDPITYSWLESIGFVGFNKSHRYMCFPSPLGCRYKIDFESDPTVLPKGWYIYLDNNDENPILKHPKNIHEINSFYHGICDKWLFNQIKTPTPNAPGPDSLTK